MIYLKCKKCGKNICVFDKRKAQSFTCLRDEGCHGNCQPQQENLGHAFSGNIKGTSDMPEAVSEPCNSRDCECHAKPQQDRSEEVDEALRKQRDFFINTYIPEKIAEARADERKKVVEEAIKTVNECQVYDVVSSGSELLIKHHIVSRLSNLSKDL